MDLLVTGLVTGLVSVCLSLAWVGWRYFWPRPVTALSPLCLEVQAALPRAYPLYLAWLGNRLIGALLLVAAGAVLGVHAASGWVLTDPLAASRMERQEHIELALNPERLVPPPALPPALFMGSALPALESADRDWGKLDPLFVQAVLQVFRQLEAKGYAFALLEGYRSPERQDRLAAEGGHVTNARAFQSRHQYGLAVDVAPLRAGRLVISERDPWAMQAYALLGEEAEQLGLVWGGRWANRDLGHLEARGAVTGHEKR